MGVGELPVGVVPGSGVELPDGDADDVPDRPWWEVASPAEPSGTGARMPSGRDPSRDGLS